MGIQFSMQCKVGMARRCMECKYMGNCGLEKEWKVRRYHLQCLELVEPEW